jgi:hypothetical protein
MNTGFWEALAQGNEADATPVTRKEMGFSGILAEAVGSDSNMPEGKPLATIGKCLACGTAWYVEDRELGNGLCPEHWDDCVNKMPHFASVDPDFEIWKSLWESIN